MTKIRKQFFESKGAEVVIFEPDGEASTGPVAGKAGSKIDANQSNQKLFNENLHYIVDCVDECPRRGVGVTLRKIRNCLRKKFGLRVSKTTAACTMKMKRLGLTYQPIKKRRRNQNANRLKLNRIREYLVSYQLRRDPEGQCSRRAFDLRVYRQKLRSQKK